MAALEEILEAIDEARKNPTNFRCSMLRYPSPYETYVPNGSSIDWTLGEVIRNYDRLFSDFIWFQYARGAVCAQMTWLDTVSYSTLRQPDQPLNYLQQSSEMPVGTYSEIFDAMQIDFPSQDTEPWSKRLGQTKVTFTGEESFEDLPCLRLEWSQMIDHSPRHGYWLVCPERDYKIVYSETYSDSAAHGLEGMFIHIDQVTEFQSHQGMWIPTKTIHKHGRLFPDRRREIHPSQWIIEILDLEIGTVEEFEPLLTPPLAPGLELIFENGKSRRIRTTSKQRWTALKQRFAVTN